MKPVTLLVLATLLSCQRPEPAPELPEYESRLEFACHDNLSEYYGKATLKNQRLCYSTNETFYENFAYGATSIVTGDGSVPHNPGAAPTGMQVAFGVGGLGAPKVPPAPLFFTIKTPSFTSSVRAFFLENIQKGAELNMLSTETTKQSLQAIKSLFTIEFFGQYEARSGLTSVANLRTWSGPQDPNTAYLRVLEMEEKEDGSFDIAFAFRCKMYDNDGFYLEVTDGEIRTNIRF
ncbi:hypothetical protein GCM10027275_32520 [Rhabdobacter roseus]|uniref:Lipoprotein n=1 Tax=Rhabdobacter roseus TaxID=1655419 RepID=A0A840TMP0_9BACT|nr:hypothetical protein [Rhabdobacter roseus]MBB5285526.1 hypothetical protein [Rhabdobacter roseus]